MAASWQVGRGIADITGEAADCGMLGYGKSDQRTRGIHLRQRCRSFVLDDGSRRVLLVVAELPLPMQSVTDEVLRRLAGLFGDTYTAQNTLITVTHTHSGPGGYCGHLVYNATTSGFRAKTFGAIVDGIVESVEAAHRDVAPAELALGHGELRDASVNRSRSAFERNPFEDRAVFPDAIDPQTTLLRVVREGRPVAALSFFATHGTSMSNRNLLISSDNKGYAAYHWERLVEDEDYLAGEAPGFVAAFAQTNAGDMSPNLDIGSGPTDDERENTRIIGMRQYDAAAALLAGDLAPLGEGVDHRMVHVDLGRVEVRPEFTPDHRSHRTGRPMVAASQVAGTDEGKGFPGFRQGRHNPVWDGLSRAAYRLNRTLAEQHAPKGIVFPGSVLNRLTDVVQERVPVQLMRLGRLYLVGIPAEVTIVAGLRLRRTVAAIVGADLEDVLVVGYSNAYVHYVTTPEEYVEQRYEGGSTLFGRWELPALMQVVAGLATAMQDGRAVDSGPPPESGTPASWLRSAPPDVADVGFGAVRQQPADCRPGETVTATFESAYPNNDLRRGGSYLEVQRLVGEEWVRVADDGDWCTTFRWERIGRAGSLATITWDVPADSSPGTYRIVHHGAARDRSGTLAPFTGRSRPFTVG